jgi:hypothetical protein
LFLSGLLYAELRPDRLIGPLRWLSPDALKSVDQAWGK